MRWCSSGIQRICAGSGEVAADAAAENARAEIVAMAVWRKVIPLLLAR